MFPRKKIELLKKIIFFLNIMVLFSLAFMRGGIAQIMPYYPPVFYNPFSYSGYFPVVPPSPVIVPPTYSPARTALGLLPTPGGGTVLLPALTPTVTPTVTPTIGVATALLLGGGVSTTTLALLAALTPTVPTVPTLLPTVPTVPTTTPTIGVTTALLLSGGGISTTTLLLLGI